MFGRRLQVVQISAMFGVQNPATTLELLDIDTCPYFLDILLFNANSAKLWPNYWLSG
jgi:hypothetical protein